MMRRALAVTLVMGTGAVAIAGCEELQRAARKSDDGALGIQAETRKIQAVDSDPKNPKPFFSNNRPAGGWSSEAREIESHLGVGP